MVFNNLTDSPRNAENWNPKWDTGVTNLLKMFVEKKFPTVFDVLFWKKKKKKKTKMGRKTTVQTFQATNKQNLTRENVDMSKK